MKLTRVTPTEESSIRETLIWLLEDFQEHAEVVLKAKEEVEAAAAGSDRFDRAVARLDAALTSLNVTVPAIIEQLDRLDNIPEDEEAD